MAASHYQTRPAQPVMIESTTRFSSDPAAPRKNSILDSATTPVNQNGCFEFDRILKSGHLKKRTGKTKIWKDIYVVLRPSTLSIYKNEKESKLRHQIYLTDLSAIARLTDPKHKHINLFGLFTPAKNYHLEAPSSKDADEWVQLIRKDARIDEEEDELFLANVSPRPSTGAFDGEDHDEAVGDHMLSSSPEPFPSVAPHTANRRRVSNFESNFSGNELASHSDFSDSDAQRVFSIEDPTGPRNPNSFSQPSMMRSAREKSGQAPLTNAEQDLDRVTWQGWIMLLRSKGGVRQWKNMWGVLRPRNLILYKDESEYTARWILEFSRIVNVVDVDPLSKSKKNCLQVITEEKSYRFCTHDEESLVKCMGAFKSLLARRRSVGGAS